MKHLKQKVRPMPWKETSVMEQRIEFLVRLKQKEAPLAQLCREYGISRETGYTWWRRLEEGGSFTELRERSRRPTHSPRKTRGELPLLRDRELRSYMADVRERTLDVLKDVEIGPDALDPLLRDGFVYEMLLAHEYQHNETMLQLLQMVESYEPVEVDRSAAEEPIGAGPEMVKVEGGRHEIGADQELNYRPIAQAIAELNFTGYLAHEYSPLGDPVTSLDEAIRICDV